jgi:hypothetical protein
MGRDTMTLTELQDVQFTNFFGLELPIPLFPSCDCVLSSWDDHHLIAGRDLEARQPPGELMWLYIRDHHATSVKHRFSALPHLSESQVWVHLEDFLNVHEFLDSPPFEQ